MKSKSLTLAITIFQYFKLLILSRIIDNYYHYERTSERQTGTYSIRCFSANNIIKIFSINPTSNERNIQNKLSVRV